MYAYIYVKLFWLEDSVFIRKFIQDIFGLVMQGLNQKYVTKKVHYIWDLHRLKFSISLNLFNTAFSLQSGFVATLSLNAPS